MKRIIEFIIIATVTVLFLTGCDVHDSWGDGRPDLEHTYILFVDQPDNQNDFLSYEVAQNGDARWRYGASATSGTWKPYDEKWVVKIPLEFRSERIRSYDVVSFFWIESTLTAGTDYVVSMENGTPMTPESNGGYKIIWPQAKRGKVIVNIKRIQGSPNGTLKVQTFNRENGIPVISDMTSLINNKTAEYEVRCASLDVNKVTVTFN